MEEIINIIRYIEGLYSRKLNENEIMVLNDILKGETLESFKKKYAYQLSKKIDYFTAARMKQLIDEQNEIERWKKDFEINDFDELFEN